MGGVLFALLSAASFASMYILVRIGVSPEDPDNGLMITMIVNVVVLTGLALFIALALPHVPYTAEGIAWFIVAGLAGPLIGRNALFASIRAIGATRGAALKNNAPMVVVILAVIFLQERFTLQATLGIGLALLGLLTLAWEAFSKGPPGSAREIEEEVVESGPVTAEGLIVAGPGRRERLMQRLAGPGILGILFGVVAAVAFGFSQICRALGIAAMPDAIVGSTIGMWTGFVSYALMLTIQGRIGPVMRFNLTRAQPILWMAGVGGTLGNVFFYLAVTMAPISYVSVVAASETILTLIFGAILLRRRESIGPGIIFPAVAIFGGTALIALS
jgi:drug/metabolite transporter (DMT)-like permease